MSPTCACGCERSLEGRRRHAVYFNDSCRKRARRASETRTGGGTTCTPDETHVTVSVASGEALRPSQGAVREVTTADTPPFLLAPRRVRPLEMPAALCGLSLRECFDYALARAREVHASAGLGTTRMQFEKAA